MRQLIHWPEETVADRVTKWMATTNINSISSITVSDDLMRKLVQWHGPLSSSSPSSRSSDSDHRHRHHLTQGSCSFSNVVVISVITPSELINHEKDADPAMLIIIIEWTNCRCSEFALSLPSPHLVNRWESCTLSDSDESWVFVTVKEYDVELEMRQCYLELVI